MLEKEKKKSFQDVAVLPTCINRSRSRCHNPSIKVKLKNMVVTKTEASIHAVGVAVFLLGLLFNQGIDGRPLLVSLPRPRPDDAAPFARWLVSQSSWGVLNTIANDKEGSPFGNVVSFSDGFPDKGRGVPYFYLTALDPTARYALKDTRSSFTISEYPLGTCGKTDPEDPSCAKITLTGQLRLLNGNSKEVEFAENALFRKHPAMKGWPEDHHFQIFKLEIEDIFLINWYGGPKPLTVNEYLKANMDKSRYLA